MQNNTAAKVVRKGLDEGAREMVNREVHYCVSSLISELCKDEVKAGELMEVMYKYDYEEAAMQYIYNDMSRTDCVEYLEGLSIDCRDEETIGTLREAVLANAIEEGIEVFCEERNVEPYSWEIYEHWIVSDWLADKLAAKGHAVMYDFYGLTIWGRPTTGQAIYCDSVIQGIYAEMMAA